ncbi:Scramblase family protein [Acanthocheilonema viteae]
MSKRAAVKVEGHERRDKEDESHEIKNSSESNTTMEHFSENDSSNSKSEYFAAISPAVITSQPHPQMNFSKNAKISNTVNDQTTASSKDDEEQRNYLPTGEHRTSLRLESLKQFYIRQNSNAIDTFLGFLRKNRYVVQSIDGKLIYHVFETSNNICLCDCRTQYSQLHFTSSTGKEEIRMEKVLTCRSFFGRGCGTPICCIFSTNNSHQIIIESPPGLIIGLFTK